MAQLHPGPRDPVRVRDSRRIAANQIHVDKQVEIRVVYRDEIEIGVHRLDILVEDELILELKALRLVDAVHYATVRSYLKATGLSEALILNFGRERLDIRRVDPA